MKSIATPVYILLLYFLSISCVGICEESASGLYKNYWNKWIIDSGGNGADGVHLGDINNDGLVDVVSGWEQSGKVKVYINPGPNQIKKDKSWIEKNIARNMDLKGIEDAAFVDLDLDGLIDSVITSIEGRTMSLGVHHLLKNLDDEGKNQWKNAFLVPERKSAYMKARAAQLDGFGGADIVAGTKETAHEKAGIYWFRAPSKKDVFKLFLWQRFYIGEVDTKTTTLVVKDMNKDGFPDVVFSGREGIGWFKNPGFDILQRQTDNDITVWEKVAITESGSEFSFCFLDEDSLEDLVVATSNKSKMIAKWLRRLDTTGINWEEYPIYSNGNVKNKNVKFVLKGTSCGFIDDNDVIDLVFTASGSGPGLFKLSPIDGNPISSQWDLVPLTPPTKRMKYDNVELVDLDQDGDLDVITTEEGEGFWTHGEGVLWFENPLY